MQKIIDLSGFLNRMDGEEKAGDNLQEMTTHCNEDCVEVDDDDEDDSKADVEEAWEGEGRRSARPRKGEPASTHS